MVLLLTPSVLFEALSLHGITLAYTFCGFLNATEICRVLQLIN